MKISKSKLIHRTTVLGLSLVIAFVSISLVDQKLHLFSTAKKMAGEIAGVTIENANKFLSIGLAGAQASTAYQAVNGNVGVLGKLAIGPALSGTAASNTFVTNAGALGTTAGSELVLGSLGFASGNASSLGIRAYRTANGGDWTTTAIGLEMDVDNTPRVNNAALWLNANGNVGIGTANPVNKLQVEGNLHLNGNSIFLRTGSTDQYDVIKWNGSVDRIDMGGYRGVNLGYTSAGGPNGITPVLTVAEGNVGIGTANPTRGKLDVAGVLAANSINPFYLNREGGADEGGQITWEGGTSYVVWYEDVFRQYHRNWSNYAGTSYYECFNNNGANVCDITNDGAYSDYAETVPITEKVEKGDILISTPDNSNNIKASRSYQENDRHVIGIVSTNPGMVLSVGRINEADDSGEGRTVIGRYGDDLWDKNPDLAPLALTGRVPVKVVTYPANPKIEIGSAITSSFIPGIGMKVTSPAYAVGKTIEVFDPNDTTCPAVSSLQAISWPEDDGTNPKKPCYKIPFSSLDTETKQKIRSKYSLAENDFIYIGKVMVFANTSWYDPDVYLASTKDFKLNLDTLKDAGNNLITRIGAFGKLIAGKIEAGIIETQRLIVNGVDILERLNNQQNQLNAQQKRIDAQQQEIESLKNTLEQLKAR